MANETESIKLLIEAVNTAQSAMASALADLNKFDSGAAKAGESAKTLATHTGTAHEGISKLGDIAKEVAGPLLALFTVEKVIEFTKATLEAAAAMGRLEKETDISLETLNRWSLAGMKHNVNQEQITRSINFFAKSMADLNDPTARITRLVGDQLRISFRDANNQIKPVPELLDLVTRRMSEYGASAELTRAANDLFGRGSARLIPIFGELGRKTSDATSFTKAHVEAAEKWERVMAELTKILQVVVMDAITPLIGKMGELIGADGQLTESGERIKTTFDGIAKAIVIAGTAVTNFFDGLERVSSWAGEMSAKADAFTLGATGLKKPTPLDENILAMLSTDSGPKKPGLDFLSTDLPAKKKLLPADTYKEVEEALKQFNNARLLSEETYKQAMASTQVQETLGVISHKDATSLELFSNAQLDASLQRQILAMQILSTEKTKAKNFEQQGG